MPHSPGIDYYEDEEKLPLWFYVVGIVVVIVADFVHGMLDIAAALKRRAKRWTVSVMRSGSVS